MTVPKFTEFLGESLVGELTNPGDSKAAAEAKKLKLRYLGFARYADESGKLAYVVKNDRLVPFKGVGEKDRKTYAVSKKATEKSKIKASKDKVPKQAKTFGEMGNDGDAEYHHHIGGIKDSIVSKVKKFKRQENKRANDLHKQLLNFYMPNLFSDDEIAAIAEYTDEGYVDINRYLYMGKSGLTYMVPDQVQAYINKLDSAFEDTGAPFAYTVYTGLSSRYNPKKIRPGNDYIFRGFISTSLDIDICISNFINTGAQDGIILEIDIEKGQKSIYIEGMTMNETEKETLLPRGTKVRVVSGPFLIPDNLLSGYSIDTEDSDATNIVLFKCQIVEE